MKGGPFYRDIEGLESVPFDRMRGHVRRLDTCVCNPNPSLPFAMTIARIRASPSAWALLASICAAPYTSVSALWVTLRKGGRPLRRRMLRAS